MATSFLPSPPAVQSDGYYNGNQDSISGMAGSPCSDCSLYSEIFKSMSYSCCAQISSCETCSRRFQRFHDHHHQPEYFPLNQAEHHVNNGVHISHQHNYVQNSQMHFNEDEFSMNIQPPHSVQNMNSHNDNYHVQYQQSSKPNSSHPTMFEDQLPPLHGHFPIMEKPLNTRSGAYGKNANLKRENYSIEIDKTKQNAESKAVVPRRSSKGSKTNESRKRNVNDLCQVCGDNASGYHYNALTCEGCKGFFRRSVTNKAKYQCKYGGHCEMDTYTRRKCPDCRLKKCKSVGMLEECLLTEIQCQSKRRRKKAQMKNGDNGSADPLSDVLSKLCDEPFDNERTNEFEEIITCVIEAFKEYKINPDMVKSWENQTPSTNAGNCRLSDIATVHVKILVEYAKKLPGFSDLDPEDQIALLKGSVMEAMLIRNSCGYNHLTKTLNIHKFIAETGIEERHLNALFAFFSSVGKIQMDETEYALLIAVIIFDSDYPYVVNVQMVDSLQDKFVSALAWYSNTRKKPGKQSVAKMIESLTLFRSLSHYHNEVVACWKKRDKLSPLLCELWDVY